MEETHGDLEENWCGLKGEEAIKQSLYDTTNKSQDRRRNVRGKSIGRGYGKDVLYRLHSSRLQRLLGRLNEELYPDLGV